MLRTGDIIPEIAAGPNRSVYLVWQEATIAPPIRSGVAWFVA